MDAFTTAYIACALWSSTDESREDGGDPMDDNYDESDLSPETLVSMEADCLAFQEAESADLAQAGDDEHNGHDFWLTRNHHGAGFWDRGYGAAGDRLSAAAHAYGSCDLYIGDDGLIYSM